MIFQEYLMRTVRAISIFCRTRNYFSANNRACAKYDLVRNTRHHTMSILKLVFDDKNLSEFEMPSELEFKRMARDLISVENIRNNFEMSIIYDPEQYYWGRFCCLFLISKGWNSMKIHNRPFSGPPILSLILSIICMNSDPQLGRPIKIHTENDQTWCPMSQGLGIFIMRDHESPKN